MIAESAFSRSIRIGAIATGFGAVVFSLLGSGDMIKDSQHLVPGFAVAAIALFAGLPVAMAAFAQWGSIGAVRWVARMHATGSALIILLWIPFQIDGPLPDNGAPWILNTIGVAAASAAIAWSARGVWGYVVGVAVTGAALRYLDLGGHDLTVPLEDGLSMLEISVVLAMLLLVALRVGRAQDAALAAALDDSRAAAEAESRARQRSRFAALLHDDVLTTLNAAAQAVRRVPAIDRSAEQAIGRLDMYVDAPSEDRPLNPGLLQMEARAAVTDVVDGIRFTGSFAEFDGEVPGAVALAIVGALGEAARNSVRHAGSASVRREMRMSAEVGRVIVEFDDDGPGFDPSKVEDRRFGIRGGIRARVEEIGGVATITSAPGSGATVRIVWPCATQ